MTDGVVKSLGVGRFLDWRTLEAAGAAGGVLVCWDKVWVFTGVYGPFNKKDRECLWEELGAVRGLWGDPWCVGGDFNVTLAQGERSRQGRVTPAMRRFAQVMDDLELIDLPLQGALSRGKRLSRPISDHFPITIEGGGKEEALHLSASGPLGPSESERRLFEEEFARKKEAKDGYAKWVKMDEIHWRQLSRELWLREGDKKYGVFSSHGECAPKKECNGKSEISGVWLSEERTPARGGHLGAAIYGRGGPFGYKGMNGDKAPGSDGFTGAFWQFCWEFVNEEVMEMFKEFHEHKTFLKSLNATFLVLIPKKGGAEELGTSGRSACWVDYTNSWLREWIWSCISTAKFSVLVNGELAGFFPSSKGLRQGDPLSPYLFIMGMEVLSAFIRRAVEGGCITGCRMQRAASGLRINLAKSEIIPVGEVDEILEMGCGAGCKVGEHGKKSSPSQLGEGVCEQERGAWLEENSPVEQSPSWKMGGKRHQNQVLEGHLVWGCGAGPEFPQLFNVAAQKGATVGDLWTRMLAKFGVKDAYGLLTSHSTFLFPKKGHLGGECAFQASVLCVGSYLGRILTIDRLQKRRMTNPNRCYYVWVFPETVKEVITSWKGSFVAKRGREYGDPYRCLFLDGVEGKE
ncbi:hypothetical protein CK203_086353 [Vitis vinifera]|uniref:Uncharacterized protein n=1 Tax=Vitis vinifera TaxID=29760 RepID=A0A438DBB6_VITVI|nr:hypothetical protein CK203_086353 [Vitis vinifera]